MQWIESTFPDNGMVNLEQIIEIRKFGFTKTNIKFTFNHGFVCWTYPNTEERDKEYAFLKEVTSPKKIDFYG